jgi:hypothetical protein
MSFDWFGNQKYRRLVVYSMNKLIFIHIEIKEKYIFVNIRFVKINGYSAGCIQSQSIQNSIQ